MLGFGAKWLWARVFCHLTLSEESGASEAKGSQYITREIGATLAQDHPICLSIKVGKKPSRYITSRGDFLAS